MVVHREPEQDHEQEHRQPGGDAAVRVEVEQVLAPAPLEDRDDDAVGGATESRFIRIAFSGITIERNETSRSRNANARTKPNTIGTADFIASFQSFDAAVSPVTAYSMPGDLAERRRDDLVAERRERVVRRRCRCPCRRAGSRPRPPCRPVRRRPRSARAPCRTRAPARGARRRPPAAPGSDASPEIATTAGVAPPGNASLTLLYDCISFSRLRERVEARDRRVQARAPGGRARRALPSRRAPRRAAGGGRDRGSQPQTRLSPSARLKPPEERHPHLVDAVAEPGEHRRQDGQRADHRDGDDHHRADRERHERLVAGEEHPGHRDHHRDAGDEHGATRGRGCGLERCRLAPSRHGARHARGGCRRASSRRRPRARSAG